MCETSWVENDNVCAYAYDKDRSILLVLLYSYYTVLYNYAYVLFYCSCFV